MAMVDDQRKNTAQLPVSATTNAHIFVSDKVDVQKFVLKYPG